MGAGAAAATRATCPFLRLETDGVLTAPGDAPSDAHRCVAISGPRVLSHQQQELVCLRSAHVDCPRYRRAIASPRSSARGPFRAPPVPRAILASLVVLALSAGISFGFVMQRGGIDLPPAPTPATSAAAVVVTPSSVPAAPTPTTTPAQPTALPTATPSATPSPTPTPSATPEPTPSPTPKPTASGGIPSASRLAVLKPCSGQKGCYVYTIRAGDNLFSIAHWFGVPLATIYAWNPTVKQTGIHPGNQIKIPTPTR